MTLVIWDGLLRSISDGAQNKFPTCSPSLRHCDPESSRTLADHYQGWERSLALRIFLVFLEQTQDICGTISILDKIIHIYNINLYLQYQLVPTINQYLQYQYWVTIRLQILLYIYIYLYNHDGRYNFKSSIYRMIYHCNYHPNHCDIFQIISIIYNDMILL